MLIGHFLCVLRKDDLSAFVADDDFLEMNKIAFLGDWNNSDDWRTLKYSTQKEKQ